MQPNGATVWARKTISSEIFICKPDKWFKIWFFIVNRVNYKDNGKYKRAECFIPSGEIERSTGASTDQVKKCLKWLRDEHSISTERSTRGIRIIVLKYNIYQDLKSYSSTREAPEKHQRSTTIGEVSKKQITTAEQSSADLKDNQKDMGWGRKPDDEEEVTIDLETGEKTEKEKPTNKTTPEMKAVFALFSNPEKKVWHMRKVERESAQILYETYGYETLVKRVARIEKEKKLNAVDNYMPIINSPSTMLKKMEAMEKYLGI